MSEPSPVPAVTRDQVMARNAAEHVVLRVLTDGALCPSIADETDAAETAFAIVEALYGHATELLAEAPQPKVLTEAEATSLDKGSSPIEPWCWAPAIEAAASDSGKWEDYPYYDPAEGDAKLRIARSAIENLYRCGFALVVMEAPASPAPEPCATCGGKGLVSYSGRGEDGPDPCPDCGPPPPEKVVDLMAALEESVREAKTARDRHVASRTPEEGACICGPRGDGTGPYGGDPDPDCPPHGYRTEEPTDG